LFIYRYTATEQRLFVGRAFCCLWISPLTVIVIQHHRRRFWQESLHFLVHILHFLVHILHFLVHTLHFLVHILHFIVHILHFLVHILHFLVHLLPLSSTHFHFTTAQIVINCTLKYAPVYIN